MLVVSSKSNLGCEAGCGLTVSWSDHAPIILGSCSDRPRIGNDVSRVFGYFLWNFAVSFFPESSREGFLQKKRCHQTLSSNIPQSYTEVMAVFQACHQTSPKVILKWWLSFKIVIKGCPKFCWSDGCLSRLSSKAAQSSAEVMAVFKDCHQTSPKVILKWWLSFKIVIKHRPKLYWSDGCLSRLSSKAAQSSAEVMAVFKDCHQTSPKVILKWWLSLKIVLKHRPKLYWSDGCL